MTTNRYMESARVILDAISEMKHVLAMDPEFARFALSALFDQRDRFCRVALELIAGRFEESAPWPGVPTLAHTSYVIFVEDEFSSDTPEVLYPFWWPDSLVPVVWDMYQIATNTKQNDSVLVALLQERETFNLRLIDAEGTISTSRGWRRGIPYFTRHRNVTFHNYDDPTHLQGWRDCFRAVCHLRPFLRRRFPDDAWRCGSMTYADAMDPTQLKQEEAEE
ncbi:hypothetical protein EBT31_13470 [bacterium]|nr:hypothetical protein [bacterium]